MKKVYLGGQPDEYDNNWKNEFKNFEGFEFYDWEIDSDQTSPDTFFPDDLNGIRSADIMVANPGIAPSEATWIEIGYFYALNSKKVGKTCNNLIIIWRDDREPKWSIEFVEKAGIMVSSIDEAKGKLIELR